MSVPVRHLPVLQNWDCHVTGTCCKEYLVTITEDEKQRIDAQGWDRERDLGGLKPFKRGGPWWSRVWHLNHREDGSCVFLSAEGRCRIHEKHGFETKPLPCRLFPFVLVPQGDRWGVGVRYACPSAARNKGRPLPEHDNDLREFADLLAKREGLTPEPDGSINRPPPLTAGRRVSWNELRRYVDVLLDILRDRTDPFERRMRRCLMLADQCRKAPRIHEIDGHRLTDMLRVLAGYTATETPRDLAAVPRPTWIGRVLFRQLPALYTRKDHGPNRGLAARGRLALLWAALRFARGKGTVPRMHAWMPETTFAKIEEARGPLSSAAQEVLERYYVMKVGSMQFCGATSFGMGFWEGFESLALTLPVILWVKRAFAPETDEESVYRALSIVDDHFGFNKVLGTLRQRFAMNILTRRGETSRLIAWYSR